MTEQEYIKRDIADQAEWIGEDGDMCVSMITKSGKPRTERGAIIKFKQLIRKDLDKREWEDYEVRSDKVGMGWFNIVKTQEDRERFDGEWYVSYVEKNSYPVWVFTN